MLELVRIGKVFRGIVAVDSVTFSARPGEITGYLGPNGSGKSTTMKMITGLIEPTSGEILFHGQPVRHDLNNFKQRIGYVPEEPHLYSHLTGLEYLVMVRQLRNLPERPFDSRITRSCSCSPCTPIVTSPWLLTQKECARRYCFVPRCFTTPSCCCWMNHSPGWMSPPAWFCAA